jgi:chromate reductase
MHPINSPEVMVPFAADKVDGSGNLTDAKSRGFIKDLLESLVSSTRKIRGS